jgi:hypothetical protein
MSDDSLSSRHDQDASALPRDESDLPEDLVIQEKRQHALQGKPVRIPRSKILTFGKELDGFILSIPDPRQPLNLYVSNFTPDQRRRGKYTKNAKGQVVLSFEGIQIYAVGVPLSGFSIWWAREQRPDGTYLVPELLEFCDLPDDAETDGLLGLKEHLLSRWGMLPIKLNL